MPRDGEGWVGEGVSSWGLDKRGNRLETHCTQNSYLRLFPQPNFCKWIYEGCGMCLHYRIT